MKIVMKIKSGPRHNGGLVIVWVGLLVGLCTLLYAGIGEGADAEPIVEVKAPEGAVRVGERFTVTATVGWEGDGAAIDIGRPTFEVPGDMSLEASSQESQTVLRDGSPHSLKKYDLIFVAEKEGKASIGPISFDAKREGSEFGLTGRAVEIEILGGRRSMWVVAAISVVLFIAILFYRKRRSRSEQARSKPGSGPE